MFIFELNTIFKFKMMNIREFILNNLMLLYRGGLFVKINASFKLCMLPAVAVSVFEYFSGLYTTDLSFLYGVLFVLMIDHVLGTYLHYFVDKDFTFKANLLGLLKKLTVILSGYSMLLIMHDALDEVEFLDVYFKVMIKLMVLLYPLSSALVNMSKVTNGAFPPSGLLKKIKNFEKTGDLESLKEKTKSDKSYDVFGESDKRCDVFEESEGSEGGDDGCDAFGE